MKLTDADSEQLETQHWLEEALGCEYLDEATFLSITSKCEEVGKMLNSMMSRADTFTSSDY